MTIAIHHGDCLEIIPRLVAEGVVCDAVVTDPPYLLKFMGKRWDDPGAFVERRPDKGNTFDKVVGNHNATSSVDLARTRRSEGAKGQAFHEEWARAVFTIMRPGGFLIAFGGTRTFHRLVCAIEDAGFVVQDQIAWMFGSGFPKRRDMLKPAFEPICLAYKPGGKRKMQVDECRIVCGDKTPFPVGATSGNGAVGIIADSTQAKGRTEDLAKWGRWPANVAHDGSDEVLAAFPESNGQQRYTGPEYGSKLSVNCYGDYGPISPHMPRGDTGSAARFFYTAKADKQDRWGSRHPTVKPIDLIRWLVRLVTPPGGLVLDPFAGSGTTGGAAFAEGRNAILIEREPAYVADIRERIAFYEGGGMHSTAAKARRSEAKPLGGLFDMAPT